MRGAGGRCDSPFLLWVEKCVIMGEGSHTSKVPCLKGTCLWEGTAKLPTARSTPTHQKWARKKSMVGKEKAGKVCDGTLSQAQSRKVNQCVQTSPKPTKENHVCQTNGIQVLLESSKCPMSPCLFCPHTQGAEAWQGWEGVGVCVVVVVVVWGWGGGAVGAGGVVGWGGRTGNAAAAGKARRVLRKMRENGKGKSAILKCGARKANGPAGAAVCSMRSAMHASASVR